MLKKLLVISAFSSTLLLGSTLFEEQKINVYNVPLNDVKNITPQTVDNITKNNPLYSVSQAASSGKIILKTSNDDIIVVINKNRNPILNYNDILTIASKYAEKNIPLVDINRINKTINFARLQTSATEKKENHDNNQELITALKKNPKAVASSTSSIDFSDFTLINTLNYFIENYSKINKNQTGNDSTDTRYQLVKNIKEKLAPYTYIDSSLIDYNITLEELKLLKTTLANN